MFTKKLLLFSFLAAVLMFSGVTSISSPGGEKKNMAAMRRFYEGVGNKRNLQLIDELVAAEFVEHQQSPGSKLGREGVK